MNRRHHKKQFGSQKEKSVFLFGKDKKKSSRKKVKQKRIRKQREYGKKDGKIDEANSDEKTESQHGRKIFSGKDIDKNARKKGNSFARESFLENAVRKSEKKIEKKENKVFEKKYRKKKYFQKANRKALKDKEFHVSKNAAEVTETSANKLLKVGKQMASAASVSAFGDGDDKESNAAYSAAAEGTEAAYTVTKYSIKRQKKKAKKISGEKSSEKKPENCTFKREDNFGTESARESGKREKKKKQEKTEQKGNFRNESTFEKEKNPEKAKKASEKKESQQKYQKKKTQREYAKKIRKQKSGRAAKDATKKASDTLSAVAKKLREAVGKYAGVLVIVGVVIMVLMLLSTALASCGSMFSDGIGTIVSYSYQSSPSDIDAAELSMTAKEAFMNMRVYNIETEFPDYDEYVYSIGDTGHDAFQLISYLSAVYTTFTASGVEAELEQLFNEMCVFSTVPSEEKRTRIVIKVGTRPVLDPETGEPVTNPETGEVITELFTYEETEEYKVKILTVTLSVTSLESVAFRRMTAEQSATYEVLNETRGLIQTYWSPLAFDWHGSIISGYGYSFDKVAGEIVFNRGIDIAVSSGTEVFSAMDGTVKAVSYDAAYGNYVVIENTEGHCTKYGYLGSTSVSAGQSVAHGQTIGRTGSGGLHLECMFQGNYFNPLFYFE